MTDVAMLGLGVDTGGLRRGEQALDNLGRRGDRTQGTIKRATDRMASGFSNVASRVFNLRTAIATLAGTAGIGLLVRNNMQAIDSLAKFADTVGESTENVQAFRRQAELAGIDVRSADNALQRASRRAAQAADGVGAASDAYERLGLNAEEISRLSPVEAFEQQAEAIRGLTSRSDQLRAANELYGREAEEMIRIVDMGAGSFAAIKQEMEATGEAVNRIDAARIEEANDAITRMRGSMRVAGQFLAIELSDTITTTANHLQSAFTQAGSSMEDGISGAVDVAVKAFAWMLERSADVITFIDNNPMSAKFGILGWLIFGPQGALIAAAIGATFDIIQEGMASVGVGISEAEDKARRLAGVQAQLAEKQGQIAQAEERMAKAAEGEAGEHYAAEWIPIIESLEREVEELETAESHLQAQVSGSSEATAKYNDILNGNATASNKAAEGMRSLAKAMRESRRGGREGESPRDPDEIESPEVNLIEQHERIQELVAEHQSALTSIAQDGAEARMQAEAYAQQYIQSLHQQTTSLGIGLLQTLGRENKAMAIAAIAVTKGMAIAQTIAHTQTASMLAFASQLIPGDPTSIGRASAAAASVKAMGALNVGLITASGLLEASQVSDGGASAGTSANPVYTRSGTPDAPAVRQPEARPQSQDLIVRLNRTRPIDQDELDTIFEGISEKLADGAQFRSIRRG